jgi:sporulation protein YlmC with PRC-barrel domain
MLRRLRYLDKRDVSATSGEEVGQVDDSYFDDEKWTIRYLIVDTSDWLGGRNVLIAPEWTEHIEWSVRRLYLDATSDQSVRAEPGDPAGSPHVPPFARPPG